MPMLRLARSRPRPVRKAKAVRVTTISTDQLVLCPSCGDPMRLSDAQKFECKQCDRAFNIEGVLHVLEKADE